MSLPRSELSRADLESISFRGWDPETDKLPAKLSALLRIAVDDARKVARDPRYKFDMDEWHVGAENGNKCSVCMAGAVMACTLKVDPGTHAEPFNVPGIEDDISRVASRLLKINRMREGNLWSDSCIHDADQYQAINQVNKLIKVNYNPKLKRATWETYLRAADILAEVGL